MKKINIIFEIILIFVILVSCNNEELRNNRAEDSKDIKIGIVFTSSHSNFFLEGVNLAVDEINENGGLFDKKINTVLYDDENNKEKGQEIAIKLANDKDIVAVIGHKNSRVAIPASITYENLGVIFLSYGAKDPNLTLYSGNYTFRNIPNLKVYADAIADYAKENKAKKIIVFHERDSTQMNFTEIFKKRANELGIEIATSRSYFEWDDDFKELISSVKNKFEFDTIFIAGNLPAAGILIKQIREMGISSQIIGGDGIDSSDLWAIAGKASENVIVPTVFNPNYPNKLTRDFVNNFENKYDFIPDTWAAQGYDAVSLIAYAIIKNRSAKPLHISTCLRFLENWNGVTGNYSFTNNGDIVGKRIHFKKMKNGKFVFTQQKIKYHTDLFNYFKKDTIRIPISGNIETIDPCFTADSISIDLINQLFLGLTSLDIKTYEPIPEFAKSWNLSDDKLTYTFNLREDVKWSSGKPITAHDYVWTIKRNILQKNAPYKITLGIIKNADDIIDNKSNDLSSLGVYAKDDYTLVFELKNPLPSFPRLTNLYIYRPLPSDIIDKFGDSWTDPENIVTNGPYKVAIWEKDRGIFLKKNQHYYNQEKVLIPEVRYYIISQNSLGLAMYENDELDIIGSSYLKIPLNKLTYIKEDPVLKDEYSYQPSFCTYAYIFNCDLKPVDNPIVRQAISYAIDRQLIIDIITMGNERIARTFTPPSILEISDDNYLKSGISFNPEKAKSLLSKAGYPNAKDFPDIKLLVNDSNETNIMIASAIKTILKHYLNINLIIFEKTWSQYIEYVTENNIFHCFNLTWCGDYYDAENWLYCLNPKNTFLKFGWENSKFSELIDSAVKEPDQKKKNKIYLLAENILCHEEAVSLPLYFQTSQCLVKSRIKNWNHMALGGQQIRNWYFENK